MVRLPDLSHWNIQTKGLARQDYGDTYGLASTSMHLHMLETQYRDFSMGKRALEMVPP